VARAFQPATFGDLERSRHAFQMGTILHKNLETSNARATNEGRDHPALQNYLPDFFFADFPLAIFRFARFAGCAR
jgi:hypothetical protein